MLEGRQILPFENRIWSFMAPIEEDPVESRVQVCCFEDIRITDKTREMRRLRLRWRWLSLELLQSRLKRVLWFHGSASPHWHGAAELLLRKLLPDWFSHSLFKLFAKPICGRGIMFEWPLKAAICCSLLLTGNYWRDTLADRIADVKTRDYLEARNSKWYYYYYILEVSPSLRSYFWGLVKHGEHVGWGRDFVGESWSGIETRRKHIRSYKSFE